MICVKIDDMVPCLVDNHTKEIVETEVIRLKRPSFLSKYNKKNGWYVNWQSLLTENEIYALVVKGSVDIQGLVALKDDLDSKTSFVTWMVASPQNNPQYLRNNEKRYIGVGGHLFAIASQVSMNHGMNGAVSGYAANEELMNHYCEVFGAVPICMLHPYQIFIPETCGAKIREVYTYEWTDEHL